MKKFIFILSSILFISCGPSSTDEPNVENTTNRKEILKHWANNIIIPAYKDFSSQTRSLDVTIKQFTEDPNSATLNIARETFKKTYISWQKSAFFEVGPAKNVNLRLFANNYPANPEQIKDLALQSDYKLNLATNAPKQGLPAIDYLLNGVGNNDTETIAFYTTNENSAKYKSYLKAISKRLSDLSNKVHKDWSSYKDSFIKNDGSSSSASLDNMANEYLLYYEKYMRNGKLRFPVGYTTVTPLPKNTEAYYTPTLGKILLKTSVTAMQDFFNGKSYGQNTEGPGFASYLKEVKKEGVTKKINDKYNKAKTAIDALGDNLADEMVNNRTAVLTVHDIIQSNVVNLKVDMMQALNISVAYFDGDGD